MSFSVFDLHCDTAYAMLNNQVQQNLQRNRLHVDLERASVFPGYVQCFSCFTSPEDEFCKKVTAPIAFQMQKNTLLTQLDENRDRICLAYNAGDITRNQEAGMASAILTIEGTAGFYHDPGRLEELYCDGFRITTLGWNEENCLVGSHLSNSGLSDRGREYVRRAQSLGMIVDVSHVSDTGFWDIVDITQTSVVATHSNRRRVHTHSRNLTDEMFMAICQTGGVVGINMYAQFLGENATVDTVCDHILHFIELDPECRHISLGGDLDGCELLPCGFDGVQSYPLLAESLARRGVSHKMISNLFWENALEVFARCCT